MTSIDDEWLPAEATREHQEREIAFMHRLSEIERALGTEASALSRVFDLAGIEFDPVTVIALRFVDECSDVQMDPVEVLAELDGLGVLERAVEIAKETTLGGDFT